MTSFTAWLRSVLVFALVGGTALAQNDLPPTAELPVTRLVLFTSGVGYFEHAGTVTGDQTLDLTVGTEDMDDVLQSLVLQDLDGGSIRPVRYPSRDPLARILGGYALDLSGNPSLAELLVQARGERLTVEASSTFEGALVNVERVDQADGEHEVYLTLHADDGLVRVRLAEVARIQFQDERLQDELEAALGALSSHAGDDARTLRLAFEGDGERRVRIGYVQEMPVWKTSYRLVLGANGTADLQGWAIVDNPTATALTDVDLAFVAGQPISFVTSLYEPVYADRPRVGVATAPGIVPPLYEQEFAQERSRDAAAESAAAPAPSADAVSFGAAEPPSLADAGVSALAEGARTGATFVYRVSEPVTVGRYESAMVPIVNQPIEAHRLSIFTPGVLGDRPLRGVRMVNDTGLHLAAGTVTVFDQGGFTGNARMADLLPDASRILTFAVDLDVTVAATSEAQPEQISAVEIVNGLISTEVRSRVTTEYQVAVPKSEPGFLIVEHPKRAGFDVVSPEPAPVETSTAYRFGVAFGSEVADAPTNAGATDALGENRAVPTHLRCNADEACALEIVTERVESRTLAFGNVTPDQIFFWLENVELSDADRTTLQSVMELQRRIVALDRDIAAHEARLAEIAREQDRIRSNMGALDRNSSLYRRYVSDLEEQEDQIELIRRELEDLRMQRAELQNGLDDLVAALAPR